jgi:hypothetical protein
MNWILTVDDFKQWILAQVSVVGLDAERFKSDYARDDIIAKVQKAWEAGTKITCLAPRSSSSTGNCTRVRALQFE